MIAERAILFDAAEIYIGVAGIITRKYLNLSVSTPAARATAAKADTASYALAAFKFDRATVRSNQFHHVLIISRSSDVHCKRTMVSAELTDTAPRAAPALLSDLHALFPFRRRIGTLFFKSCDVIVRRLLASK